MTTRRLSMLHKLERLAHLREEQQRIAMAQAVACEGEARCAVAAIESRLEVLTQWRTQLVSGACLALDRFEWAHASAVQALDEHGTAHETLQQHRQVTQQRAHALEASHRYRDAVVQRRDRLRIELERGVTEQQREHAIETWLTLCGDKP